MSVRNYQEKSWIEEELSGISLGDKRLDERALKVARELSEHPSLPINHACSDWASTKAAYRFFENESISAEKILEPHIQNTRNRISHHEHVILVQDTSMIDFTTHYQASGLGTLGGGGFYESLGLIMHSTLALTEKGLPLGILSQNIWARNGSGKRKNNRYKKIPIEQRESFKWLRDLRISAKLLPQTKITMVCDREADIYELFNEAVEENINLVIRLQHNRVLYDEENEDYIRALDLLDTLPSEASIEILVPGNGKRKPRLAKLETRYTKVNFTSSPRGIKTKRMKHLTDLELWMVEMREVGVRAGVEPLHWVLLTLEEVKSPNQALNITKIYRMRWEVELYFKALKTGCGVEKCRLEAGSRIIRYINVMSVVAWRILWMTWINRVDPNLKADAVFSEAEWKSIWLRYYAKEIKKGLRDPNPPRKPMSIKKAIRWMAMRAGFLGRKSDGEPGLTHIWRGWLELIEAAEMYELLKKQQLVRVVGNR